MSRLLSLSVGFLTGVGVFLWLGGPVLEAEFGPAAILIAYGALALGAAGTAYVGVRRFERRTFRSVADGPDTRETDPANDETDAARGGGVNRRS